MSFDAHVLKFFIASPSDVPAERAVARQVIYDWNAHHAEREGQVFLPVGWETHTYPEAGGHPQDLIAAQALRDCDFLVAMFHAKLGQPTPNAPSGTVEEIEEHVRAGKPAMVYFSQAPLPHNVETKELTRLRKFQESIQGRVYYGIYSGPDDFAKKFRDHLALAANKLPRPAASAPSAPDPSPPRPGEGLSELARELLLAATASEDDGYIYLFANLRKGSCQAGGRQFMTTGSARELRTFEAAGQELERAGLVEPRRSTQSPYMVSALGFEVADEIRRRKSEKTEHG